MTSTITHTPRWPGVGGFSLSNKGFFMWILQPCAIYFKLTSLEVSPPSSVRARWMQAAKTPRRLRVLASLVVRPIAAPPSSEWSTRRERTRADSSTPAHSPERISAPSLRWEEPSALCHRNTLSLNHVSSARPWRRASALTVLFFFRERDFKNKLTTPHFLCHSGPTCTFPFVTMGNAA